MSESLPFGLSHVDSELADRLRSGLDDVEIALRKAVTSDYPFVTETSSHLVNAGGKRFRPLLALVAAQYGDPDASGNVPGAVVAELTHLATLYHDDVMDEAALRRGAPSANARWDNTVAILTGDFLFARAADIAAASCGSRRARSSGSAPGRSARRSARWTVRTPSRTTSTCSPARPARSSRLPAAWGP